MHPNILHKQYLQCSGTVPVPVGVDKTFSVSQAGAGTAPLQSNNRQRWLTMATDSVDRAGDILILDGMEAQSFLRNPQFLWQHGASGETISTIGKVLELRVVNSSPSHLRDGLGEGVSALQALVEYASPEHSPLAEQVYQLDIAGLLPANSIGFRPIEYEANEFGGYTFTEWELIECSKVELPMNPEAVDRVELALGLSKGRASSPDTVLALEYAADWLLNAH